MFKEVTKLLKPSTFCTQPKPQHYFLLTSHWDVHLQPCSQKKYPAELFVFYNIRSRKPVGGTERGWDDYNRGIRGVICTGWQLVELSHYLLLVLSQSSSMLLYVITVVNLLVLPCLLPTLPSLLALLCPPEIFVFFLSNFSSRGSRVVQSELPLFIVISWDNEQMTCHLEHLEPGVKLGL